jgi:hypothetical protein
VWLCGIQLVVSVFAFLEAIIVDLFAFVSSTIQLSTTSPIPQEQSIFDHSFFANARLAVQLPPVGIFHRTRGRDACTYPILSGSRPRYSHSLYLERADLQHLSETTQVNAKIPTNHIKAPCTTRTNVVPDTRVIDQTPAAQQPRKHRSSRVR